jgi:predicted transcriptional regulator
MYTNCNRIFEITVPAVKAAVARDLSMKYGVKEGNIARALGMAQPGISKYLNGKYSNDIKTVENAARRGPGCKRIVAAVLSGKSGKDISYLVDRAASEKKLVTRVMSLLGN